MCENSLYLHIMILKTLNKTENSPVRRFCLLTAFLKDVGKN